MKTCHSLRHLRHSLLAGICALLLTHPLYAVDDPPAVFNGMVVGNGTYDPVSPTLPSEAEGAGTRMMWYPGKAAFRAGGVTTQSSSGGYYTTWDNAYIGRYSTAFGFNTQAWGLYSFAAGNGANATSEGSIAIGSGAQASGYLGEIAMGTGATATYSGSAIGPTTYAYNNGSAFGKSASASNYGIALGRSVVASNNSTAVGQFSSATGFHSAALGSSNVADGSYATALGYYTTARAYGSTVVGQFNTIQGNPTTPVLTDPVFVVGNGSASYSRSDAFIVYQSGNAALAGTLTANGSPVLTANSGGGITLSGGDRVITMGTSPSYVGGVLTVRAGDANSSIANINGGNLILSSGASTGTGFSAISFKTAPASTSGTVNQPIERMTINSNGRVGIGVTNPASALDVAGDIRASENLFEKTVTFTPTAPGWYRIASRDVSMGGTVRINGSFDNKVTDMEFQFIMGGYGNDGAIQLTRWSSYNGGNIQNIRISSDNGQSVYLDVEVSSANAPGPLTVAAYGMNMPLLAASPVVGAVQGTGYVSVLAVGHGFRTTQGGSFAGNVGAGVSAPAARMDIASIGGTDALRIRTQTDTVPSTPFRITADGKVLVKKQGDISMGGFMAGAQP